MIENTMKNTNMKEVSPELLEHLKQMNIKSQKWVDEDPKNRWSSMITEDPKHWADYKIYTVNEFKHYMAETTHWDLFKSVNGIRPRFMNYHLMTTEEIEADNDALRKEEEEQIIAEKKEKEDTIKKVSNYGDFTEKQLKEWRVI
jgi:hypothetical protein